MGQLRLKQLKDLCSLNRQLVMLYCRKASQKGEVSCILFREIWLTAWAASHPPHCLTRPDCSDLDSDSVCIKTGVSQISSQGRIFCLPCVQLMLKCVQLCQDLKLKLGQDPHLVHKLMISARNEDWGGTRRECARFTAYSKLSFSEHHQSWHQINCE